MIKVQTIGKNVKRFRLRLSYSQANLAQKAGVAQSSISLFERGKGNTTIGFLNALADALAVDTITLILGWPAQDSEGVLPGDWVF